MTEAKPLDLEGIKEKIIEDCRKENFTTESYPAIHFIVDKTIKEIEQRIKSAVKGLSDEIDELIEQYEEGRAKYYYIFTAKRDTASRIKTKIKKWFPM